MIVLGHLKLAPPEAVFFSGTFAPWHEGHAECVQQALTFGLKLVVCPDQSPWKNFQVHDVEELKMQLAGKPVWFYAGFLQTNERNPTIFWIKNLSSEQRSLLMGDDAFLSLHKWHEAQELVQILRRIYVVPRLGDKNELQKQQEMLLSLNSKLEIHFLTHHPFEHISSSLLREK